jgi:hypothetical protein
MSEAALCTAWGVPVRGREKHALEVFNEVVQYWGGLQKEGRIERFDVAVLTPNGGDLGGFLLVRGTAAQIDAVRRSEDYQRLINRSQLIADHFRVADAFVDEGLAQMLSQYGDEVGKLD